MVKEAKTTQDRITDLERMRRETEALLAASEKLIAELKDRLEELRQHRLVNEALMRKHNEQKKP